MLRKGRIVVLSIFANTVLPGQETQTIIKTEVVSTFLWGEDARSGAISVRGGIASFTGVGGCAALRARPGTTSLCNNSRAFKRN